MCWGTTRPNGSQPLGKKCSSNTTFKNFYGIDPCPISFVKRYHLLIGRSNKSLSPWMSLEKKKIFSWSMHFLRKVFSLLIIEKLDLPRWCFQTIYKQEDRQTKRETEWKSERKIKWERERKKRERRRERLRDRE